IREFKRLEETFPDLDDETLCRGGKLHKKLAENQIKAKAPGHALAELKKAEEYYRRAFALRHWFYPRINELSVRVRQAEVLAELERAGEKREVTAERVLADVQRDANAMFLDERVWEPRADDDHVWIPAGKGEAAFLARNWSTAEAFYSDAKSAA